MSSSAASYFLSSMLQIARRSSSERLFFFALKASVYILRASSYRSISRRQSPFPTYAICFFASSAIARSKSCSAFLYSLSLRKSLPR